MVTQGAKLLSDALDYPWVEMTHEVSRRIDEMLGMENMMILDRYWIRDHR
jgi:hypothetical protein